MYEIFTNICPINDPHVGTYTSTMEHMGYTMLITAMKTFACHIPLTWEFLAFFTDDKARVCFASITCRCRALARVGGAPGLTKLVQITKPFINNNCPIGDLW